MLHQQRPRAATRVGYAQTLQGVAAPRGVGVGRGRGEWWTSACPPPPNRIPHHARHVHLIGTIAAGRQRPSAPVHMPLLPLLVHPAFLLGRAQ